VDCEIQCNLIRVNSGGGKVAKVTIRKEDLERVRQVAERTARRTNERVIVAHDRVHLQDDEQMKSERQDQSAGMVNFR
jgi:hypothetical protein